MRTTYCSDIPITWTRQTTYKKKPLEYLMF